MLGVHHKHTLLNKERTRPGSCVCVLQFDCAIFPPPYFVLRFFKPFPWLTLKAFRLCAARWHTRRTRRGRRIRPPARRRARRWQDRPGYRWLRIGARAVPLPLRVQLRILNAAAAALCVNHLVTNVDPRWRRPPPLACVSLREPPRAIPAAALSRLSCRRRDRKPVGRVSINQSYPLCPPARATHACRPFFFSMRRQCRLSV
jgi:hypothetical protein